MNRTSQVRKEPSLRPIWAAYAVALAATTGLYVEADPTWLFVTVLALSLVAAVSLLARYAVRT